MDARKPKLRWTPDAEDLSMVGSRLGRLMLQGSVGGKCYRLVVEMVDRKEWIFEPVTGYRYATGDLKKGGAA